MTKRRAPGTACPYGKRCIAQYVIGEHRVCALHGADVLFSVRVRMSLDGACWAAGRAGSAGYGTLCNGELQCAHIFSRRYRALRWSYDNAVPLCMGHHVFFTHRPAEWEQTCRDWGVDWDTLRKRALEEPPMSAEMFLEAEGIERM